MTYPENPVDVVLRLGDVVLLGGGWATTITAEGLACDCGKGALCPLNPQYRVSGVTKV